MRTQGGGKPAKVTRYRRVKREGHPLLKKESCLYEHRAVLYDKIGGGVHLCHWCKKQVGWEKPYLRLAVDHLDTNRWNNSPDNLVPSCVRCNSARSKRADFLTHCDKGHEYTENNVYIRPDGKGRMCRSCAAVREKHRKRRK